MGLAERARKVGAGLPRPVRDPLRRLIGAQERGPDPDGATWAPDAPLGSTAMLFRRLEGIPGYFNVDDCAHFSLLLAYQSASGIHGDLFEIGSYFGRSTAVLAAHLQPGERLVVCDAFEAEGDDPYPVLPSPDQLRSNLSRVNPYLDLGVVDILVGYSTDVTVPPERQFRFAHIDGGHAEGTALHDLRLAAQHLVAGGVIAVDDYGHRRFPGVASACDRFIAEDGFAVVADLNRHRASGRKLYLSRA